MLILQQKYYENSVKINLSPKRNCVYVSVNGTMLTLLSQRTPRVPYMYSGHCNDL